MAEGGNTATLLAARASYKKTEGYLYLTEQPFRIVWVNPQTGEDPLVLSSTDFTNLYANKAGVKPPKLRVVAGGNEYNFVFTAPEPICFTNRDEFKEQVKALIRDGMTQPPAGGADTEVATPDVATPNTMDGDTPLPALEEQSTAQTPMVDPAKELAAKMFRMRKKVLLQDPDLAGLHRSVVIKGKLSEDDFWASRQHLIEEAAVTELQKKGKSSRLVDPKPGVSTSGDMRVVMTPQLALDIFEEWPVVHKAYKDNVPANMSEAEFWKRYFESRLYHNHKASVRSSAAQHVIKEDPIFDKYLEPVDNELEPRQPRSNKVNRLVDLLATREDHEQTGNAADITMQAGKQKSSLPLIRKFNEHSERLLNSALGDMRPVKRIKLDNVQSNKDYDEVDIEDLHKDDDHVGVALDMANRQRYFEGRSLSDVKSVVADSKVALTTMKNQLNDWTTGLHNVRQDTQIGSEAIKSMSENISSHNKVKTRKVDVSVEFLKQMQNLEATANEYLRQFWYQIYPPPEGTTRLPPEERGKKLGAMRDQLVWVQKRAPELVHLAATNRWDSAKVEEAFKPLMNSIDKALGFVAGRR
ncbi:hypothetical protein CPB86DRAFT_864878 [Serendipita vermifera]|nr:hypothetical protein CPB86DRAFT_864878 [Serendipita vermifera]